MRLKSFKEHDAGKMMQVSEKKGFYASIALHCVLVLFLLVPTVSKKPIPPLVLNVQIIPQATLPSLPKPKAAQPTKVLPEPPKEGEKTVTRQEPVKKNESKAVVNQKKKAPSLKSSIPLPDKKKPVLSQKNVPQKRETKRPEKNQKSIAKGAVKEPVKKLSQAKAIPPTKKTPQKVDPLEGLIQKATQKKEDKLGDLIKDFAHSAQAGKSIPQSELERMVGLLQHHLMSQWNIPAEAQGVNIDVVVELHFNKEGYVVNSLVVRNKSHVDHALFTVVKESVFRAIQNPDWLPVKLPEKYYDSWKKVVLYFNPQNAYE